MRYDGVKHEYSQLGNDNFHPDCVKCADCGVKFDGSIPGPYRYNDLLLCKPHVTERKQGARPNSTCAAI